MIQAIGIGLSALSSFMNKKSEADNIKDLNRQKVQKFNANKELVLAALGTLDTRTSRAYTEANRAALRKKLEVRRAQHKAEGEATVKAAHLGGAGKRTVLATFRPSSRVAGDMITDANINLQTELTNLTEHFNDTAAQMINNLNNHSPVLGTPPSTTEMLMTAGGSAFNYYSELSAASKAQLKEDFSFNLKSGAQTNLD